MADSKISGLPAAGALAGTEEVAIVQSGTTVSATTQNIANLNPDTNMAENNLLFDANRDHDMADYTLKFSTGFTATTTNTTEDIIFFEDDASENLFRLRKNGGLAIGIGSGNGAECADLIAIGYQAASSLGTTPANGFNSVFLGAHAGEQTTTATDNVIIGEFAGQYTNGSNNVLIGSCAGQGTSLYTGTFNCFIGKDAGGEISSGGSNIGIGYLAMGKTTTQSESIGIGVGAGGYVNTYTGTKNCSIGHNAGARLSSGSGNIFFGHNAGAEVETGLNNVFIGEAIGTFGAGDTSGDDNVCIGQYTGYSLKTGNNNTLVGVNSGQFVTSGSTNIMIGHDISKSTNKISTGSSNILIGNSLSTPTSNPSNYLMIGNTIKGDLSNHKIGVNTSTLTSQINASGDIETLGSSDGFIVLDRTNATRYRIYTDGGTLSVETA